MHPTACFAGVRLCRAATSALVVGATTGDPTWSVAAIAATELTGTILDAICITPLYGNVLWLLLLYPFVIEMYLEDYIVACYSWTRRELMFLAPTLVAVALYISTSP